MLVGIIDIDLFISRRTFIPNPEVMLYSSYHKKNKDIVHLLLDGKNIDLYEKIYIFRNKKTKVKFPEELYSRKNVICRGQYFSNGFIMPIPEEVFSCIPDKSIYDKYYNYWGKKKIKGLSSFQYANFISLRKNEAFPEGRGTINIYDYNIGSLNDYNFCQEKYEQGCFKKIHFCYPIQCKDLEIALKWANQEFTVIDRTKILYQKTISWTDIYKVKKNKPRLSIEGYITDKKRFFSQKELDELFEETMNKIFYCIINDVSLYFRINPKIRITSQFILLEALCNWRKLNLRMSFFDFCQKKIDTRIARELFLREHSDMIDWFNLDPYDYKKKGGIWLNDRRTNSRRNSIF